jgi:glucose-6-phosphate-specific signal transduction histidine kinase
MTDDEASTHFLARAVHYRLEAENVTDPDLVSLYRLVAEGLENVAKAVNQSSDLS